MIGLVFASVGTPFCPWHAAHTCAFASMSSAACACAGAAAIATPTPAKIVEKKRRVSITAFLPPVTAHGARQEASIQAKRAGCNGPAGQTPHDAYSNARPT